MQQSMFERFTRNPGLPIARTPKGTNDHEITTPELRRLLAERKRAQCL